MHTTAAALRSDTPVALPAALAIPLAELFPSPLNPRKTFNTDRLDELAASVAELGVIEPLIVRANQGMYEIIAGERRYRAAKQAGLSVVPCLVREMTDAQVLEHALAENRQRADVHPLEEAEAIQQLQALDPAYTVAAVAKRLGMSATWVYGRLKLLQLSPLVQSAYRADAITAEHADLLAKLSQDQQEDALEVEVFNRLLYAGLDQAEEDRLKIWSLGDAIQAERWDLVAPTLNPPAKLRAWIGRSTVVDVSAQDVQQQFPDIAEALEAAEAEEAESILAVSELRDLTNAEASRGQADYGGRMIRVADLFCGAGGASTGLLQAADARGVAVDLTAVNHWPVAVQTHTVNHPHARHFCQSVETLDPELAVPGRKLDLLIAAPECVHFSTARGGRPMSDQSRASAWHLLRWLEVLRVEHVLIENVPEFQTWGPLGAHGRPLKSRKGETFRAFIAALESLNYRVEYRVLNAADYGGVTTRRRLFLQARRGRKPILWPKQTHSKTGGRDLFGGLKKWRAAREVIDWSLPSESIFTRKRPLKPATVRRILEGLRRFGGPAVQPFLVQLTHGGRLHSVDEPFRTLTTAKRGEIGIAEPFVLGQQSGAVARPVSRPVPTVSSDGAIALVQTVLRNHQSGRSIDDPVPVLTAGGGHIGVTEAFLVQPGHGSGGGRGDRWRVHSLDGPIGTIPGSNRFALAEPFITKYTSTGSAYSVENPIDTITTKDRYGLVQPVIDGLALDIRFRMLQPHELAAAMSFPGGYAFTGTKGDTVRQIGNAWDVAMGRALAGAILEAHGHGTVKRRGERVA